MADIIIQRETPGYFIARVIWAVLSVVESILSLQVLLRLIGANPQSGFTDFIYNLARPLLAPFFNIVPSSPTGTNGGVFEWTTLIAMVMYWLLSWVIIDLFFLGDPVERI